MSRVRENLIRKLVRELIKQELDEANSTASVGGEYQTPHSFKGSNKKGKKKGKAGYTGGHEDPTIGTSNFNADDPKLRKESIKEGSISPDQAGKLFDKLLKKQTKGNLPSPKDIETVFSLMRKKYGIKGESTNEAKISVEPNWEGMWRFFKRMAKTNPGDWYKIQRAMGKEWTKINKMASKKGWVAESTNEAVKTHTIQGNKRWMIKIALPILKKYGIKNVKVNNVGKTNFFYFKITFDTDSNTLKKLDGELKRKNKKSNNYSGIVETLNDSVNEGKYHDYRNDDSMTPKQKIGMAMRETRDSLKELESIVKNNVRLKTELNVDSRSYWKNTHKALSKISERLVNLANKVGQLH